MILTLQQVAEQYVFTPRQLRDIVRRRQIGVLTTGKAIRFDEQALRQLEETLRRCPSKSSDAPIERVRSRSAALSNFQMGRSSAYERVLSRTSGALPKKKPPSSKRGSSAKVRVPVDRDHRFRWKMITQSGGT